MIEKIERLGEEVETLWKKEGYAKEVFPRIASEILQKHRLHEQFSMETFLQSFSKRKALPRQLFPNNEFGQPPITLYWNDALNFLIDIYFWVTPESSIHSHGFRGAFTVLQGKSFHCEYDFLMKENDGQDVFIGDLLLKEATLLEKGAVQEVHQGLEYIHQVWHIAFPTVSLVIRTDDLGPYHAFLKPHFAYRHLKPTPLETKQIDTLVMLHRVKSPQEERFLEGLIRTFDPYQGCCMHLRKYFGETSDLSGVKNVLERTPKFEKWAPYLLESFKYALETQATWDRVQDEGERLLIALLSSLEKRDEILSFMETHYPGKPALTTLMKEIRKLVKEKKLAFELNETALDVLELLLHGYGEKALCQKLSRSYQVKNSPSFQREIVAFCNQLRAHELFKVLLSPPSKGVVDWL